jgi:quinoprotein relay system zinc metallohydrolase 2
LNGLLLFILLCSGSDLTQARHPCDGDVAAPASVEEVASGVFVRSGEHALMSGDNHGAIANVGFIVGSRYVAVIDTGGSACDGAALRAAVRATTSLPIRYVINTHVHPDHIFGNAAFLQDQPLFVGHHNLARALAARGAHYLEANLREMGDAAFAGTEIVPPGLTVDDRHEIDLGGRILELVAHPTGHTDNDLTVLDRATGTLWTGDLVFLEHLPVIDGSLTGWMAVTNELKQTSATRAVPGHGPASVPWPQGAAAQERYLSVLIEDLRRMIADGRTMNQAIDVAAHAERGEWQLFDEFNPRNASVGFAELEWE